MYPERPAYSREKNLIGKVDRGIFIQCSIMQGGTLRIFVAACP